MAQKRRKLDWSIVMLIIVQVVAVLLLTFLFGYALYRGLPIIGDAEPLRVPMFIGTTVALGYVVLSIYVELFLTLINKSKRKAALESLYDDLFPLAE